MEKHFSITVKGMHCSGCKNLITMSLEDGGMTQVHVDEKESTATFSSDLDIASVTSALDRVFSELPDYQYSGLTLVKIV